MGATATFVALPPAEQREGHTLSTTLRLRGAVTAAALVLPLAGTAFVASPAQAANDPKPIASAADWVVGQLNGNLMTSQYGGNDIGLSIDAAAALRASGGHDAVVAAIRDAVQPNASGYYTYTDQSSNVTTTYANSLAKLLVFVEETGGTPTTYDGNLINKLNGLANDTTGRVADSSAPGSDFASIIGQAYAARGLDGRSNEASQVLTCLLTQQAPAGYFSLNMPATGCQGPGGPADPDATALATIQLSHMTPTVAITTALGKAKSWLQAQQKSDGSFGGGTSTPGSNSNSTGVIGAALAALGDTAAAQKAATYVRSLQVHQPAACTDALSNAQGVIGYDAATLATGRYNGLANAAVLDKFRRSTTQGLLVLGNAQTGAAAISAPKVFARSKKATTVSVSGVAPGDSVCLTGSGVAKLGTAGQDGVADVSVTAPRSGRVVYTLVDSAGHSTSATLRVLPNKKLKVYISKRRATRGAHEYVVVSGLAVGEPVRIKLYGTTIARTANAKGKAAITFRAGKRLRTVKVKAFGRFGGVRHGTNTFKVVR